MVGRLVVSSEFVRNQAASSLEETTQALERWQVDLQFERRGDADGLRTYARHR